MTPIGNASLPYQRMIGTKPAATLNGNTYQAKPWSEDAGSHGKKHHDQRDERKHQCDDESNNVSRERRMRGSHHRCDSSCHGSNLCEGTGVAQPGAVLPRKGNNGSGAPARRKIPLTNEFELYLPGFISGTQAYSQIVFVSCEIHVQVVDKSNFLEGVKGQFFETNGICVNIPVTVNSLGQRPAAGGAGVALSRPGADGHEEVVVLISLNEVVGFEVAPEALEGRRNANREMLEIERSLDLVAFHEDAHARSSKTQSALPVAVGSNPSRSVRKLTGD